MKVQKWKKASEIQGVWAEGGEIRREPENFQGQDDIRDFFCWLLLMIQNKHAVFSSSGSFLHSTFPKWQNEIMIRFKVLFESWSWQSQTQGGLRALLPPSNWPIYTAPPVLGRAIHVPTSTFPGPFKIIPNSFPRKGINQMQIKYIIMLLSLASKGVCFKNWDTYY